MFFLVYGTEAYFRMNVNHFTHDFSYFFVEIDQKTVFSIKERPEVVFVVVKEGAGAISRYDAVPVKMLPITVIGKLDISNGTFSVWIGFDGKRKCHGPVGGSNGTAVPPGLLGVMFIDLQHHIVHPVHVPVILYRCKIGG